MSKRVSKRVNVRLTECRSIRCRRMIQRSCSRRSVLVDGSRRNAYFRRPSLIHGAVSDFSHPVCADEMMTWLSGLFPCVHVKCDEISRE